MNTESLAAAKIPLKPALTSDYNGGAAVNPLGSALRAAADQGIEDIHHCHDWNGDNEYTPGEIAEMKSLFRGLGLRLLDTHASEGQEKYWMSPDPSTREAGVRLIGNRMLFTSELGASTVVLHVPGEPIDERQKPGFFNVLKETVDKLALYSKQYGVRVAFENYYNERGIPENFSVLEELMRVYSPEFAGLCLDTGHNDIVGINYNRWMPMKDRIISVHLHETDTAQPGLIQRTDDHLLPFHGAGTIPWSQVTELLANSSYVMEEPRPLSLESSLRVHRDRDNMSVNTFLTRAQEVGMILAGQTNQYIEERILHNAQQRQVLAP